MRHASQDQDRAYALRSEGNHSRRPGAAGLQFVCTFTRSFKELPLSIQYLHAAALCAVALSVLLMTPATLHRIAFQGEDDASFFTIGSSLVIAASIPFAVGIAADTAVVFFKVTDSIGRASVAGTAALCVLLGVWLGYPVWRRSSAALR
jgi:Family of unknown function (DUF6328)